jgi:cell fate (sporulation/competence/biofilm development) regulator YlbF (YheA/YmcA/DUF963 family)
MTHIFKARDEAERTREILDDIQATDNDTMSRIKHARNKLAIVIDSLDKVILDRVSFSMRREKEHNNN